MSVESWIMVVWLGGAIVALGYSLYVEGRRGEKPDLEVDILTSFLWPVVIIVAVIVYPFALMYRRGQKHHQKKVDIENARRVIAEDEARLFAEAEANHKRDKPR